MSTDSMENFRPTISQYQMARDREIYNKAHFQGSKND